MAVHHAHFLQRIINFGMIPDDTLYTNETCHSFLYYLSTVRLVSQRELATAALVHKTNRHSHVCCIRARHRHQRVR